MNRLLISVAVASLAIAGSASADVTRTLNMSFQSGATFAGTVTFANDYSFVTGVSGVLNGYQFGIGGYLGSGSDTINWVWSNGANFSSGANNYSTFLMDGPGSGYVNTGGYSHWVQLAYNYAAAPALSFTSGVSVLGTDNYVDYSDPMVSGSFGAVPEPASWALMITGFGLVGSALRRRRVAATA